MKTVLVRYQVKPERANENEDLVRGVFDELRATKPAGLRYTSYKLDDGVSFVHLAMIDTADGSNPLGQLPAFKKFQAEIRDRCVEPPLATELNVIGTFASN